MTLVCPLQFDLQQAHIYCDPELVLEEGCCEILLGGVSGLDPAQLGEAGALPWGTVCWRRRARKGMPRYLRMLSVLRGARSSVLTPALPPHWTVSPRDLQGPPGHPEQ